MHYLITGGTGFIGRALSTQLAADGNQVSVLSRNPSKHSDTRPESVALHANLSEISKVDVIFNLQGESLGDGRWTAARKKAIRDSRVQFTESLVDWMSRQPVPPRQLISGSAIGWYGDSGDRDLIEDSPPGSDFGALLCHDWEQAAAAAQTPETKVARVRTGLVLGQHGGPLSRMLPAFRMGLGGRLGSGQQWMSWISLHDMVRLLKFLADQQLSGIFNAVAPEPVTNVEFTEALAAALHRPALLPMPTFALRLMFGEMSDLLLGSQRVIPEAIRDAGFEFDHSTLEAGIEAALAD